MSISRRRLGKKSEFKPCRLHANPAAAATPQNDPNGNNHSQSSLHLCGKRNQLYQESPADGEVGLTVHFPHQSLSPLRWLIFYCRAGHLRYFWHFSLIKNDFLSNELPISAPVLFKKPPPIQINLIKKKKIFCYWKNPKIPKVPSSVF